MVILIVEDDFLIGWALNLVLAVAGHDVIGPAASADDAFQFARAKRPELAFVDINIAGDHDGIHVARVLNEEYGTSCIFLTARPDLARAVKNVALGVVAKPYDPPTMLQAVDFAANVRTGSIPTIVPKHLELFA